MVYMIQEHLYLILPLLFAIAIVPFDSRDENKDLRSSYLDGLVHPAVVGFPDSIDVYK